MPQTTDKSSQAANRGAASPRSIRPGAALTPARRRDPELTRILGLNVPVAVVLAEQALPVESILQITVGTILEFDVSFGAELSLVVGDRTIGRGIAVKIGENYGLRITGIDSVEQRIGAMGSR
ncbi:MAG: FliM/FliN family flagellar motor C-terminal domain-containing protein [Phycisphaerales bacterium]|nr:FliM/FliN family flagellar motor C-terminal domain-containing protein [Phycisphaerales bacterium]